MQIGYRDRTFRTGLERQDRGL